MNWWKTFKRWRRRDADIDEEIRAHLSMVEQDLIERGESPEEAALAAHREFGNPLLVKEATREVWGWAAVERSFQDLKYAFRQMRRSPGFTLVAVLTLALGLGATTAMFSIVNGVLLTPLKLPEPDRLYMAQTIVAPRFKANGPWPVNARHFYEWRAHGQSWEQIALIDGLGVTLTGSGEPQPIHGLAVSHNFLKTLGIQPALGRDFRPEEELPGNSNVVILSDSLWRNRFASAPSIVGQSILLDGVPNLVVGIMPELRLPNISNTMILRPLGFDVSQARAYGQYNFYSIVRLKPGVQPQAAISEMNALIADLVRQFKIESKPGMTPLLDQATARVRPALWLLLGTVGAVLLIVCVNVGNLMLLRMGGRLREAGVRMALGASRLRLFGFALTEAVALVAIGGILGLFLADAGIRAFTASAPVSLPRLDEVRIDWRVLLFCFRRYGAVDPDLRPCSGLAAIENYPAGRAQSRFDQCHRAWPPAPSSRGDRRLGSCTEHAPSGGRRSSDGQFCPCDHSRQRIRCGPRHHAGLRPDKLEVFETGERPIHSGRVASVGKAAWS